MTDKQKYIFLDCDGVICHQQWAERPQADKDEDYRCWGLKFQQTDPDKVELINQLAEALDAEIVLSSTWRMNLAQAALVLYRRGLKRDLVGATPVIQRACQRGDEIQQWMNEHGVKADQIVIIDDGTDMAHLRSRLIQTSMKCGIVRSDVVKALALFGLKEILNEA